MRTPLSLAVGCGWGVGTTINDAIAGWKLNGWDDLSPTTSRRYEVIWRLHVKDTIGRRRLVDLTPRDLECYFRQLKAQGQSQASGRYARSMLHRACRLARKWSNGARPNPVADTELPAVALRRAGRPRAGAERGGSADDPAGR